MTIPASAIVSVIPGVLSAGGSALQSNGLILTTSTRIPIGTVASFGNANDVADYFGPESDEANAAAIYFNGYDNSYKKPGDMLMAQYNTAAVAAYLRGGPLGLTLTQLQAIPSGTLTLSVDGTPITSATISLSAASSFSNAAALIEAGFTSPDFAVSYDSVSDAFVFLADSTGNSSTITFATTGALATALNLTQATGAVLSQGANTATPSAFMSAVTQVTENWMDFATLFDPDVSGNANKLLFAQWANSTGNRFGYVCWDTDASPTTIVPATSSLGYLIAQADLSGTCLVYAPDSDKAIFVLGAAASIDFERTNGRITFKFKSQSGLVPDVTNETIANNLEANGYNFYGAYATANDGFQFFANGVVSGDFQWYDSFINQIWLNNALQQALMVLLTNTPSIPYNASGYALIEAACLDPILAALNFGAMRPGVPLSSQQRAQVNNAAGTDIADTLQTQGWYLQIKPASPQVRQARGTPPMTLWYMDGGSVQRLNLASIMVQ